MLEKAFIGIDIGLKGGIVIVSNSLVVFKSPMPLINKKEVDFIRLAKILKVAKRKWNCSVGFEQLHAIHLVGATQTFALGFQAGLIEGIVSSLAIPYLKIKAVTWQKFIFRGVPPLMTNKKNKKVLDTKAMARSAAKRIFPKEDFLASKRSSKPHEGMVDAACIAKYIERNGL